MSRDYEDPRLGAIELFCLTAQQQSFSGAARSAGLTPAAVSRAVARLEERLGVRLLQRTTRSVRLTPAGQGYFEQVSQALGLLADAEAELSGAQTEAKGLVRLSLPTSYGHFRVLPLLPEFRRRFPQIELELHLSNRNVDLIDEGFDLAVRGRTPPDSGLVARRLEDAELVLVAAPRYLKGRPLPQTPQDLKTHECIQFRLPRSGQTVAWPFRDPQGNEFEQPTQGALRISDDILAPITLALAGAGLTQTYRFLVQRQLESGELVELLKPWGGCSRPFSLLYPANRHLPLRVRVLLDFLVAELSHPNKFNRLTA